MPWPTTITRSGSWILSPRACPSAPSTTLSHRRSGPHRTSPTGVGTSSRPVCACPSFSFRITAPLACHCRGQRSETRRRCVSAAPLGGGHSPQVRLAVSSSFPLTPPSLPSPSFFFFSTPTWFPTLSIVALQWPGYESWERQIQIRDQTRHRNEITLERFAKLVAGAVDRFLTAVWPFFSLVTLGMCHDIDGLTYSYVERGNHDRRSRRQLEG